MVEFYEQVATVSFTLLGFWIIVVQMTHQPWLWHRTYRRVVIHVSLYYVIPGLFSLIALATGDQPLVWRTGFALASAVGAAEAFLLLAQAERLDVTPLRRALRTPVWTPPVYVMIGLVAFRPKLPAALGLSLTALQMESMLVVVLLLLGLRNTWVVFRELTGDQAAVRQRPTSAAREPTVRRRRPLRKGVGQPGTSSVRRRA
jgi:hypothetical protein